MGFMTFQHGDNRFYNNIFVQQEFRPEMQKLAELMHDKPDAWDTYNFKVGTRPFEEYPTFENGIASLMAIAESTRQTDHYYTCQYGARAMPTLTVPSHAERSEPIRWWKGSSRPRIGRTSWWPVS